MVLTSRFSAATTRSEVPATPLSLRLGAPVSQRNRDVEDALDNARAPPGCNCVGVETELGKDTVGMLADRRYFSHPRLRIIESERRDESAERPGRRVDVAPLVSRGELRMFEELVHRSHSCIGDLR